LRRLGRHRNPGWRNQAIAPYGLRAGALLARTARCFLGGTFESGLHPFDFNFVIHAVLTPVWQIQIELRQRRGVAGSLRCIEDFHAHNASVIIVIDDNAIRHLGAILDGAIRQIDVNRIRLPIHPDAHGLVLSK
jgi:hypothetical protein